MKKIFPLVFLVSALVLVLASTLFIPPDKAVAGIKVVLEDKQLQFDVAPQIVNGRVLVPLRGIFAALQADVKWDAMKRTVTVKKDNTSFQLTVNQKTAYKDSQKITLDAPPVIINGRTMVPLRFIGEALGSTVEWKAQTQTVVIKKLAENLPIVGSQENLQTILNKAVNYNLNIDKGFTGAGPRTDAAWSNEVSKETAAAAPEQQTQDHSTTNVQVTGVDEADIVKTDGQYLYHVSNQRVVVTKAVPAAEMKITGIIKYTGENFNPQEMYVDEKHLVIIGSKSDKVPLSYENSPKTKIYPPPYSSRNFTKAIVYDISDKANIKRLREVELEGSYVSSRKIGTALYLVANKYIDYYIMQQKNADLAPVYRDSATNGKLAGVSFDNIRYFPDSIAPNYMLIAGLDLARPDEEAEISTYLGAGNNIYASPQNLYVAVTKYETLSLIEDQGPVLPIRPRPVTNNTEIYKFALNQGKVEFKGQGEVPGTILNQFSMDESGGYFRIATTTGEVWRNDENTSKNNVYILDDSLDITGQIENIAPGERIYSVRFMGDRGYMVTFKNVDPLFVIDLKEPKAPKVLGALKIPGYSDYLHPYDENHIIGFGKDTVEMPQKDRDGRETGSVTLVQGMKIAIFDVSDVQNPKEMLTEKIGDRGTDSELLRNHKALLFARDKNLPAFPITVIEAENNPSIPSYSRFVFQGAYVYNVDLVKGFTLQGKITHLSDDDYKKAGNYWPGSEKNVERIIFIGDNVYTLSQTVIKAHRLADLKETGSLQIPR